MEYDFRKQTSSPYDFNIPSYTSGAAAPHPPSFYPKIGGGAAHSSHSHVRNPPFQHAAPPASAGMGIRVAIKPEYRITAPPALLPQLGEIPRSNFHFDFEFERKVLIEAMKETPDWIRLGIERGLTNAAEPPMPSRGGSNSDSVVSKYIAAGLSREAVPIAVANYGDNPTKVKEFAKGFNLLREMGFSSNNVAEALLMNDNNTDKALAHFLNNTSW